MVHKLLHPHRLYTLFKYAVYLALLWNVWLFFAEDWRASVVLLDAGSGLRRYIELNIFQWQEESKQLGRAPLVRA